PGDAAAAPVAPPAAAPAPRRGRRRRFGMAAAGVSVAGTILAMVALAAGRDPAPEPELDPQRIAVLYLDDDSPDGDLQYLANGLTEMLIHELSQVEALEVVSRNGVKPYRQGTIPFDSMVSALRVGSVVEGSVARSADSVRVTVQLIDASTHSHLESRVVVRPLGDVLALQGAVSEEVSGFLRRRLGQQVRLRQAEQETRSAKALDLVLRGEQAYEAAQALQMSGDSSDVVSARRMLGEADALLAGAEDADPRWARPTVGRAWVAVQTASWSTGGEREAAIDSAVARADRVLARQPAHARALEARGAARRAAALEAGAESEPLLSRAEQDLRAAVAAEPGLASAWGRLSLVLEMRGRLADADLAIERALEHDAWLADADGLLIRRYYNAMARGDYRAAAESCDRARRYFPRDWRFVECRLNLLRRDPSRAPDTALAWRLVAELEAMRPPAAAAAGGQAYAPISWRMAGAAVAARAGDAGRARAEMARARLDAAVDPEAQVSLVFDEAYLLLLLGDRGGARERLNVYLSLRPTMRPMMGRDPDPVVRELLTLGGSGAR
ncbi:MAG TPA: hypothetical protein VFR37_17455, partial [Longimicrobium sp.]|nr:hypothetical protein [Longimicrobium sp.]